jgi:hypothetical protein
LGKTECTRGDGAILAFIVVTNLRQSFQILCGVLPEEVLFTFDGTGSKTIYGQKFAMRRICQCKIFTEENSVDSRGEARCKINTSAP